MRLKFLSGLMIFASIVMFSCEQDECCVFVPESAKEKTIQGKWRLFEQGWSPGAGYFIDPVPPTPEQYIIIGEESKFSSNMEGFKDHTKYLILDDTYSEGNVLALFKKSLPSEQPDDTKLDNGYTITLSGDTLKLSFRWCFEGCHLGFKRIY